MTAKTQAKLIATLAAARRRGDDHTVSVCERKLKEGGVRL